MRLRTFHAATMKQAMEQIRNEIGEEALIISTNRNPLGKGVSVTVAQESINDEDNLAPQNSKYSTDEQSSTIHQEYKEQEYEEAEARPNFGYRTAAPTRPLYSTMPDYITKDIENILIKSGVSSDITEAMLRTAKQLPAPASEEPDDIKLLLAEILRRILKFEELPYKQAGLRTIIIGTPGAGKTLTTAKIAARIVKSGHKVNVITCDYKRAGGIEQLSAFTNILGTKLQTATNRDELKSILATIPSDARVIIDTAGANPYDFQELKELGEFAGLIELSPVLVFPSGGDPLEAEEIARAFSFLGVGKMLVTRIDLARRYGSIISAAHAAGLSLSHTTGTEKVLGDFHKITPEYLAELLMTNY